MKGNKMYTRYYDGYSSHMPKQVSPPVKAEEAEEKNDEKQITAHVDEEPIETKAFSPVKGLGSFKSDDILLIALLFLIATESADDFLMPLILGALLLG